MAKGDICRVLPCNNIISKNRKGRICGTHQWRMRTFGSYDLLLSKQDDVCAICKEQNNVTRNGKIKRFAIDHCHKTGETRGLLCSFCNAMIGYARDNIQTLEAAIAYLKLHETPK